MKSYFNAFKRYFDFSGRSSRSQFWLFQLFMMIVAIIVIAIDTKSGSRLQGQQFGVATSIFILAHTIPSYSVMVRRLHDIDRTGWWVLIAFTGIGAIVLFVFALTKGTDGPNRFGNPVGGLNTSNSAVGTRNTKIEELEKLNALKVSGAITDAEFQQMKSQLV